MNTLYYGAIITFLNIKTFDNYVSNLIFTCSVLNVIYPRVFEGVIRKVTKEILLSLNMYVSFMIGLKIGLFTDIMILYSFGILFNFKFGKHIAFNLYLMLSLILYTIDLTCSLKINNCILSFCIFVAICSICVFSVCATHGSVSDDLFRTIKIAFLYCFWIIWLVIYLNKIKN